MHPLIVTSYLGRDPSAVPSLVGLAELLAIPVVEAMAYHVNFPARQPAARRLPVSQRVAEPAARPGRRGLGDRQRRALDPGGEPAV